MEQKRIECTDDVGIIGWPLGLPPVNAKLSAASASSDMTDMTLPSCTPTSISSASSSSSDSDSESTNTSFFPEKSTSLGTLIGIHSSSQFALVQDHSSEGRHRGKSFRHRMLCSFLGCGGKIEEDSLSPYWDMDDRESVQEYTHGSMQQDVEEQERDLEDQAGHSGASCPDESWTRSHSCRPSLRLILQHPSPMSPWRSFNNLSHYHGSMRSDPGPIGSRLYHFWLAFCGKLSSSLATG